MTRYGVLPSTIHQIHNPDHTGIQKSYHDIAHIEISSQFGVDFMKKSWNEADSNQPKGSSIAALLTLMVRFSKCFSEEREPQTFSIAALFSRGLKLPDNY